MLHPLSLPLSMVAIYQILPTVTVSVQVDRWRRQNPLILPFFHRISIDIASCRDILVSPLNLQSTAVAFGYVRFFFSIFFFFFP